MLSTKQVRKIVRGAATVVEAWTNKSDNATWRTYSPGDIRNLCFVIETDNDAVAKVKAQLSAAGHTDKVYTTDTWSDAGRNLAYLRVLRVVKES